MTHSDLVSPDCDPTTLSQDQTLALVTQAVRYCIERLSLEDSKLQYKRVWRNISQVSHYVNLVPAFHS